VPFAAGPKHSGCCSSAPAQAGEARTSAPALTPAKESPRWQELSASLSESLIPHPQPPRNFQLGLSPLSIARLHGGADVQLSSFSHGDLSTYFGITGRRDYRDVVPHFHEAHVDEDSEVIRADREYFRALAFYVMQRPAKSNSVLELKIGKACLWFRHVRAQSGIAGPSELYARRRDAPKQIDYY
jgi:hypothetical protein